MKYLAIAAVLIGLCMGFQVGQVRAQDLTPTQADFNQLDTGLVTEVLGTVAGIAEFKTRVDDASRFLTDVQATVADLKTGGPRTNALAVIFDSAEALAPRSAALRQAIGYNALAQRLADLKDDFDKAQTLSDNKRQQLVQDLGAVIGFVRSLARLGNAADLTKKFLADEVQQFIQAPQSFSALTFQILAPPSGKIFGDGADIAIQFVYDGGVSIHATGLRLDVTAAGKVTFDVSHLKLDPAPAIQQAVLGRLVGAIPGFGLPVQFEAPTYRGNAIPPTITVPMKATIPGFDNVPGVGAVQASLLLVIPPKGPPSLEDHGADVVLPIPPPGYPIGTSGLVATEIKVGYQPAHDAVAQFITLGMTIAPGPQNEVGFHINTKINLPFDLSKGLTIDGQIQINDPPENVGDVHILISGKEISGSLVMPSTNSPNPALQALLSAKFQFRLDQDALTAEGFATIYEVIKLNMAMLLRFKDGSGSISASERIHIDGLDGSATLNTVFAKRFQEVHSQLAFLVGVDLGIVHAQASVDVNLDKDVANPLPNVGVMASALGISVPVDVGNDLKNLNTKRVVDALRSQLGNMLDNLGKAGARWEADKKGLFAKWESHWRDTLSSEAKKRGLDAIKTPDHALNTLLGQLSRSAKSTPDWIGTAFKSANADVTQFLHDPSSGLKDVKLGLDIEYTILDGGRDQAKQIAAAVKDATSFDQISQALGALANAVPGLSAITGRLGIGGGSQSNPPPPPSDDDKARLQAASAELQSELALVSRLGSLEQQANRLRVLKRTIGGDANSQLIVEGTSAIITQDAGVDTLAVVLHLVATRTSTDPTRPRRATILVPARVEFSSTPSDDGGPATARIVLDGPDLATAQDDAIKTMREISAPIQLDVAARHALQDLVEAGLPQVRIEGPRKFVEACLSITNATREPLSVFVQARTRQTLKGGYRWTWQPGNPDSKATYRFRIPPSSKPVVLRLDTGSESDDFGANAPMLQASRVRLWAESTSGQQWLDHQERDLNLVHDDPKLGGDRAYDANDYKYVNYTFKSTQAPPVSRVTLYQTPDAQFERVGEVAGTFTLPPGETEVDQITGSVTIDLQVPDKSWRPVRDWALRVSVAPPQSALADSGSLASNPKPPGQGSRVLSVELGSSGGAANQARTVRMNYHRKASPWQPRYLIDLAAAPRVLEGRALLWNDSLVAWRDVEVTVSTGGTTVAGDGPGPRSFSVGKVSIEPHQSLLVPLPQSEINVAIEDALVFDGSFHPSHPARCLVLYNGSKQPLSGGPLTLLSDRIFLTLVNMPALEASHPIHPRDRPGLIRYPNTLDEAVTIHETNVQAGFVYLGHEICDGVLSYSIARREIAYAVEHKGVAQNVVILRAAEPGWGLVSQTVAIGDKPSPQTVLVRQDGYGTARTPIDLRKGTLDILRGMRFLPDDRFGKVVASIVQARESLEEWSRKLEQELREKADTDITRGVIEDRRQDIEALLNDTSLCPGRSGSARGAVSKTPQ